MTNKITVGIVDNCAIFRSGLKSTLSKSTKEFAFEFQEADSFYQLEELVSLKEVAAIFLDLDSYLENNEATTRIINSNQELKIILVYNVSGKAVIRSLFDEPVHSFLFKNADVNEYLTALEKTLQNNVYYCTETAKILAAYFHRTARERSLHQPLVAFTQKEKQIIELICQEYTAKEIANKLALSKRTVENRKIRILQKMNVKNMAGIVAFAYMHNLVKQQIV